jgi:pimeloyl-ACP methyl ester carboxylesterase
VDGFLLSYYETVPYPFNSTAIYPLAVELHGLTGSTIPTKGGTGGFVFPATQAAAAKAGFILIDVNTRTGSGWYIDSNFTGPQEQDLLDAIAHEKRVQQIGDVYLFGTSMGSIGTYEIGLDHPQMFKGLAVVASFSDFFEMYAYLNQSPYASLASYMLLPSGGQYPGSSAYARGIFLHLSSLRFYDRNLSGLRLYVANGAQDVLASNNLSLWPFQQANDTVLNRSCLSAAALGEPGGCTTPVAALAAAAPARFHYRYVFQPFGPHSYALLNASDMFDYWLGLRSDGMFWGAYPYPTPVPPPSPLLTFATKTTACGNLTVAGMVLVPGETVPIPAGKHVVKITPCPPFQVRHVRVSAGAFYVASTHSLTVNLSASFTVRFGDSDRRRQIAPSSGDGWSHATVS